MSPRTNPLSPPLEAFEFCRRVRSFFACVDLVAKFLFEDRLIAERASLCGQSEAAATDTEATMAITLMYRF